MDKIYYTDTITGTREKAFTIKYDNGDVETLDLVKEIFKVLGDDNDNGDGSHQ